MLLDPSLRYESYQPVPLSDRQWPSRIQKKAPIWLSTDLRDGNQALETPMTVDKKLKLFDCLVRCGFKEIEVGFPAASDTEFEFVRLLIEGDLIPDDVSIQVLTPCRKDCIEKTFEATQGAKNVIVHLYNAAACLFREVVFQCSKQEIIDLATSHVRMTRELGDEYFVREEASFRLVYGVEGFTQTELDFAIEVCNSVKLAWEERGKTLPIVLNLAATVETGPANHFADQIEYFCRNFPSRDEVIIGVHVHNDRGTAVAATEQALLAGAERVDVVLTGNGERSGNVDGIILALNLYSQGISPGLDFGNLDELLKTVNACTKIPIHPRHPYIGSLIYTAFSGTHQDGISKGFRFMRESHSRLGPSDKKIWSIPYLPVDPSDFGFSYEPVRVNSQSGKGGVSYILKQMLGIDLPRQVQVEVSKRIQAVCDNESREMSSGEIEEVFRRTFLIEEISRLCKISRIPDSNIWAVSFNHKGLAIDTTGGNETGILENLVTATNAGTSSGVFISASLTERVQESFFVSFIRISSHQSKVDAWGAGFGQTSLETEVRAFTCALVRFKPCTLPCN